VFKKVLIANRGEIAVRVARTLQQMGVGAVAVYSDPDRRAVHVALADEAHPLDGRTAAETYLRGDKIIDVAKACGAEAIHPGYGFLSENPKFAAACRDAGLIFIGPTPQAMRVTGNKVTAKQALEKAGVPVVPGWSSNGAFTPEIAASEASRIGFPLLVKAAAGGGGRGMRLVRAERELAAAIESAQREAASAFGDSQVFLERYVENPRHVEFQIFADEHGNCVHLFERDCSIQRRHQKIIEETPSPALSAELRERMGQAAVRAAKAVQYTNAGTVEFLVDAAGHFYFLEVNTRLQVEHPVTEMTLGLDLVRSQVTVAAGERLPFAQDELKPYGHAVECRVYAEDAARGFLPSIGTIRRYVPPCGPNIRVDSGVAEGSEVSTYYDPMLAKLVCWGNTRDAALDRAQWALRRFVVLGVTTNIEFLCRVLQDPDFRRGHVDTQFLEKRGESLTRELVGNVPQDALIAAAMLSAGGIDRSAKTSGTDSAPERSTPWQGLDRWRMA
jgi:acetyl-CoA carboxylase biotin carboxylase subunit